jgi:hypothetical protein
MASTPIKYVIMNNDILKIGLAQIAPIWLDIIQGLM